MTYSNQSNSYVFVDGPNMDMVLGKDILGRRPNCHERPKWDRVWAFFRNVHGCLKPTFVLNGDRLSGGGSPAFAFRRVLRSIGYDVQCPHGVEGDPVDAFIQQSLRTIARYNRPCSVVLFSHDGGYAADLDAILMLGGTIAIAGFPEEMSPRLQQLADHGASIIDIERDLGRFRLTFTTTPSGLSRPLIKTLSAYTSRLLKNWAGCPKVTEACSRFFWKSEWQYTTHAEVL